jgi:hypothetical protein
MSSTTPTPEEDLAAAREGIDQATAALRRALDEDAAQQVEQEGESDE